MYRRLLAALLLGTLLAQGAGVSAAGLPAASGGAPCEHEQPAGEPAGTTAGDDCCPDGAHQSCCQITCIATPGLAAVPATALLQERPAIGFSESSGPGSRTQPPPTRPPILSP